MKKLEISQMENLQGGFDKDQLAGFSCAGAIILGGAAIYGTGGIAAGIACNVFAAACGALL